MIQAQDADTGCGPVFLPKPKSSGGFNATDLISIVYKDNGITVVDLIKDDWVSGFAVYSDTNSIELSIANPSLSCVTMPKSPVTPDVLISSMQPCSETKIIKSDRVVVVKGYFEARFILSDLSSKIIKLRHVRNEFTSTGIALIWAGDYTSQNKALDNKTLEKWLAIGANGSVDILANDGDLDLSGIIANLFDTNVAISGIAICQKEFDRQGVPIGETTIIIKRVDSSKSNNGKIGDPDDEIVITIENTK